MQKRKREMLGDELRIGYTNGKQLEKRLNMFRITLTEFKRAMKKWRIIMSEYRDIATPTRTKRNFY